MINKEGPKQKELRAKFPLFLQAATVGIVLIALLGASFFGLVIPQIVDFQEQYHDEALRSAAQHSEQVMELLLEEIVIDSQIIKNEELLFDQEVTLEDKRDFLVAYNKNYQIFDGVYLLNPDGSLIVSSTNGNEKSWLEMPCFEKAQDGLSLFSQVKETDDGKIILDYFSSVKDESGTVETILVFQINLDKIWKFVDLMRVGDTGFVYISDAEGKIIVSPFRDEILTADDRYQTEDYITYDVPMTLNLGDGFVELNWDAVAVQNYEEYYFGSTLVANSISGVLFITAILIFFVASFVISLKVKTMKKFNIAMKEMQEGNLDVELKVRTNDELAVLAKVFNDLVKTLRSTRGNLALLFENAPLGIMTLDKKGLITTVNSKMVELVGVESRTTLLEKSIFDFSAFKESGLSKFIKQGLSGKNIEVEIQFQTMDGTEKRWHHYRGVPVIDKEGDSGDQSLLLMVSDVTERVDLAKEREQMVAELEQEVEDRTKELSQNEQYFRSIIDSTGSATCVIEQDKTLSLVNKKFVQMTGYKKEEIEGKMKWTQFIGKEYLAKMKKYHEARRKSGQKTPPPPSSYDFEFVDRKGKKHVAHLEIAVIPGTNKTVASMIDISESVAIRKDLQRQTSELESVLNITGSIIVGLNSRGDITKINQSGAELLGYERPDQVTGKNWFDSFVPKHKQVEVQGVFDQLMQGKISIVRYWENPIIDRHGQTRIIGWTNELVREGKKIVGTLGSGIDITERAVISQKIKEQKEQIEKVLEVSASVLVPMRVQTELIIDGEFGDLDDDQISAVKKLQKNENRLRNLLEYFLVTTKQGAGKNKIRKSVIDLKSLVNTAVENLCDDAKCLKVKIYNRVSPAQKIKADKKYFQQVLREIIENAVHFHRTGGQVTIKANETKDSVKIQIVDNGVGIMKKDLKNLFVPFYKKDVIVDGKFDGTGLSLILMKSLVEAHGGNLEVESEGRNKGTTVTITLPK